MPERPLNRREMAAWHAFLHAHAGVMRKLEAELQAEHDLTLPAYEALAHLSEAPQRRIRMTELSARSLLSASGTTRLVDKLEREGLVRRERCHADARVVYAVLTDAGLRRLVTAYPSHLRGVREHVVGRLARDEVGAVARLLGKLVDEPA